MKRLGLNRQKISSRLNRRRFKITKNDFTKGELKYKLSKRKKNNKLGKRDKKKFWKEKIMSTLFLSPSLIGVLVFLIIPFMVVIYYSLIDNPIQKNFVYFENFKKVVSNQAFLTAAKNSLTFSVIAVPLVVILSLLLAVLLDCNIPMKSQFRTFFLSPMMVPVASIVLVWQVIFNHNGAMNELIQALGFNSIDWLKSKYAMVVVITLFLWKNLGYNMILFMSALGSIPKDIIEVAQLEKAGRFTIFIHIKLRYISSTTLFVVILSLINSFKVFREVYLLSGDHPYDSLYMLQHFMNNTFRSLDYQKLSTAAIIMAFFMIIVIGILFLIEKRVGEDLEE